MVKFVDFLSVSGRNSQRRLIIQNRKSPDHFHKELRHIMWEYIGMAREAEGLKKAVRLIAELKSEFYKDLRITGDFTAMNTELDKAGRIDLFWFQNISEKIPYRNAWRKTAYFRHPAGRS